jgi:hypothetical protein
VAERIDVPPLAAAEWRESDLRARRCQELSNIVSDACMLDGDAAAMRLVTARA